MQEGVQAIQNNLRDLRQLQVQFEGAHAQRVIGQQNTSQSIQDRLQDLQILQQQNETVQIRKLAECEAALKEPMLQIQVDQQQIGLRLDSIEANYTANAESQSQAILQSILNPWGQARSTWTTESVRMTATVTCFHGSNTCLCSCHRRGRSSKRTPELLDRFLGVLFIQYFGLPYTNERCDDSGCSQCSVSNIRLVYHFPIWFLMRALVVLLRYSPASGPEAIIRIPRIISQSSRIFTAAVTGDVVEMREMFSRGLGSPMDVNVVDRWTPLMVSFISSRACVC